MNKEQLQFFYDEIMGQLDWCDEDEASGVDPLLWAKKQIALFEKQLFAARQAILAGGIVEGELRRNRDDLARQTEKLAGENSRLRAELAALKTPSTAGGERATLGDVWCVFPTFGEGGVKWRTMYWEGSEINKQLRASLAEAKRLLRKHTSDHESGAFLAGDHIVDADEMPPLVDFLLHPTEQKDRDHI